MVQFAGDALTGIVPGECPWTLHIVSEDALGRMWEGSQTSTRLARVDSSVQLQGWVKLELLLVPW